VFAEQLTIAGSIMGTQKEMVDLMRFIVHAGIRPRIGVVLPMERADEGFRAMSGRRLQSNVGFLLRKGYEGLSLARREERSRRL
jgi:D-arabinose 1-dehydrogenase-like Zn-dependent alcohol dehydrogenase